MNNQAVTITGHRGLDHEEPLIFELNSPGQSGVDLPDAPQVKTRLGTIKRKGPIGLPGISESRVVRHYHRLSRKNYSIDSGFYPLGSCTMKYNPRSNEKVARLPGLGDLHPLQPASTVQGALKLMHTCAQWLMTLTGMPGITLSPGAVSAPSTDKAEARTGAANRATRPGDDTGRAFIQRRRVEGIRRGWRSAVPAGKRKSEKAVGSAGSEAAFAG